MSATPLFARRGVHPERVRDASEMCANVTLELSCTVLPGKSYLGASSDSLVTCTSVDTNCQRCLEIKINVHTVLTKLLPLKCHQWKLLTDLETNSL